MPYPHIRRAVLRTLCALLAWLSIGACAQSPGSAAPWHFALMGDLPYNDFERMHLPDMLAQIAATQPAFLVHDGDIISGSARCDDAILLDRLQLFDSLPLPFVLSLGDNEWTDCGRRSKGGYDPDERLDWLRPYFYPPGRSLGQPPMATERQADGGPPYTAFVENQRWQRGPLLFVTLNLPGSQNAGKAEARARLKLRRAANLAWLEAAYAQARERPELRGIVIIVQADPLFEDYAEGKRPTGYADVLDALRRLSLGYAGQTVFVHGDTHIYRFDHPLPERTGGQPIARFTRIETPGSPFMGWVDVSVDPTREPWLTVRHVVYAPQRDAH